MTAKSFLIQFLTNAAIVLFLFACLAYYLYRDGYQYAEEGPVLDVAICSHLFGYGRSYIHFFEILGCKVQVEDRLDEIKSSLGGDVRYLNQNDLIKLWRHKQLLQYQRALELETLLSHCNGDLEACIEDLPQQHRHGLEYESHTPRAPEECDEVDNAGFLPECRHW